MTTLTQPIAKLYKRCARKHHDTCPGHFDYTSGQTYSVCSCDCHAGVSDTRPAPTMPRPAPEKPVTCADKAEAVAEAVAIVGTTEITRDDGTTFSVTCTPVVTKGMTKPVNSKWDAWAKRIVNKNAKLTAAREAYCIEHGLCVPASERFTSEYVPSDSPHRWRTYADVLRDRAIDQQIIAAGY